MRKSVLAVVAAVVLVAPATARADWLFTPYIGPAFGGDLDDTKANFGGSLGFMGAGAFGFEVDLGYTPDIFEQGDDDNDGFFDPQGNAVTLMANVIAGVPVGGQSGQGVRPYASGGVGLIRLNAEGDAFLGDISNNDFGVNLGAGVMGFVSDNVGLRGDVRYFRALVDDEEDNEFDVAFGDYDFWRATAGVTFRF
jgi:opacity protein-like surface antigen